MSEDRTIAYFSMEIGLQPRIPTYAGGLGVLAGDTVRAAADMDLPLLAVSLLHRQGSFRQRLDGDGNQFEEPVHWTPADFLRELPGRASVTIEGREVRLRAWQYDVTGTGGATVPVLLLDTDLPENADWDRTLTHWLYSGDDHYRLCQEVVLGIGGVRMLRQLGYGNLRQFHMNEGHSSLLTLELLDERAAHAGRGHITRDDVEAVRKVCLFTTHTPVPAGHDQFPLEMATRVLGRRDIEEMRDVFCCEGVLNMTYLALNLSRYVNGVAKRHGLVSRHMFTGYVIDAITNGVHAPTWTAPAMQRLFDRYIPGWREDNFSLRYALQIPGAELREAHREEKHRLLETVRSRTGTAMDPEVPTLGYARRMTAYKRPELLFRDIERLRHIARRAGRFQLVFAGKAHPRDEDGKRAIRHVFQMKRELGDEVPIAFLEDYDMEFARLLAAGVDVWLNTPQPPLEASGTSGMKAALNGVPSLSVLDGWWLEGCLEGLTGWAIGEDLSDPQAHRDDLRDAASLYEKLEHMILPAYFGDGERFVAMMKHTIALNGSFFNTQRMLGQYVVRAYFS